MELKDFIGERINKVKAKDLVGRTPVIAMPAQANRIIVLSDSNQEKLDAAIPVKLMQVLSVTRFAKSGIVAIEALVLGIEKAEPEFMSFNENEELALVLGIEKAEPEPAPEPVAKKKARTKKS